MKRIVASLLFVLLVGMSAADAGEKREGFVPLSDGRSFDGWKYPPEFEGHWTITDGVIACDGDIPGKKGLDKNLWTEKEYGDFILLVDWRLPTKPELTLLNVFSPDGHILRDENNKAVKREMLHAGDSGIYLRGKVESQVNIWCQPMGSGDINSYHKDLSLPLAVRRACMPKTNADKKLGEWNRFEITMVGDRVTVVLNGKTVIDRALLPGVPDRGPVALQHHGDRIEFRNLSIKELE